MKWFWRALLLWNLGFMVFDIAVAIWAAAIFQMVALGFCIFMLRKERQHERRRARGDHRNHGAGGGGNTAVGALARHASAGTRTGLELPRRQSTEPIRAWKRVWVTTDIEGKPTFCGIGMFARYRAEDRARCVLYGSLPGGHDAPQVDCRCGFYAMKSGEGLTGGGGNATIEVELYGQVVACSNGYRAERQRVLSVTMDRGPCICGAPATAVVLGSAVDFDPSCQLAATVCAEHRRAKDINAELVLVGIGQLPRQLTVPMHPFTPAELAAALGTEVRWAEEPAHA